MKTLSKVFLAVSALFVALFVSLSSTAAWADGENIVTDPSDGMCVTHTMFTNSAAAETGITYTVNFTPITSNVDSGFNTAGHATIEPVVFTPVVDTADAASSEWTRHYTKQVVLPAATSFPHAGAWMYEISETATGASATDSTKWTNSEATYKLRVYIENDGASSLKYGAWSIEKIDDNDGTALSSPEKVDATYPPATQSGLLFSSQYIKNQTLTITKEVEGTFADKTHEFPISVKLALPDWYHDPASVDPAPAISYTDTDNTQQSGVPTYNSTSGAWELVISDGYAHNHSLTATVPVGTRYAIDETNPNASGLTYTPSVSWNVGVPSSVSYDANGGSGDMVQTRLSAGATAADSTFTAPAGKAFALWNTESDGSGTYYAPGDVLNGDEETLYAVWIPAVITVQYWGAATRADYGDPGDHTVLHTEQIPVNEQFISWQAPHLDGYEWSGEWFSGQLGISEQIDPDATMLEIARTYLIDGQPYYPEAWDGNGPLPVYADCSYYDIHITVRVDYNYENEHENRVLGSEYTWSSYVSYYPGSQGNTFEGWYEDSEYTTLIDTDNLTVGEICAQLYAHGVTDSLEPGTITLYAKHTPITYTATYDYGYDNITDTATNSGYNGLQGEAWLYKEVSRPGYTFLGWNTESDGSGSMLNPNSRWTTYALDGRTERTFYAQWAPL